MSKCTFCSPAAVSVLWPAPTIALYYLKDRRGADGPAGQPGLSPTTRVALPSGPWPVLRHRTAWACGEMPDAPRVLSRPSLLPPSPRSTACTTRGPSCLYRAWRWAVSPRVALPWRPWHGERRWTAWLCGGAPNADLLQFLPSGLLPLSRLTTSKTVVAPLSSWAGLSPRVALLSGPWPVLRRRTLVERVNR